MRRLLTVILCLALLALPVGAVSGISAADNQTVVDSDGTCRVTLSLTLYLEEAVADLRFPLPGHARDITVNGTAAKCQQNGDTRDVLLSDYLAGAGTCTLVLRYELPDAVTADAKGNLTLSLQLLSGFSLPVESLRFSITLPGEPEHTPTFTSTYLQETMDFAITHETQGAVISGTVDQRLRDHETLTMSLSVSEKLFPQSAAKRWSLSTADLIMIGCAALALIFWLAAMGCRMPRRIRRTTPPDGITAGEIGCRLTGRGVDLTMTVISWAQMGYLLIQLDENGRVLLHKRMDMGNERSEWEVRYFRSLFGKRNLADGTGYHYARLCRKAMSFVPGRSQTFRRSSGNPRVFRVLAAFVGLFGGVSLAAGFAEDTGWRTVLSLLLGILGFAAAWLMQSAGRSLFCRDKLPLLLGLGSAGVWLLLSIPAGAWHTALWVIPTQFLAGLAALFGGRRTESGQQTSAEILGLRRYLRAADKEELRRRMKANPHYFYDLAPCALALDADRAFARQLGGARLPECPYLTTGMDGHMTAGEWDRLLRDTVNAMDALRKRMPLDRLLGR